MTPDKAQAAAPRAARPLETPEHTAPPLRADGEFIDLRPYLVAFQERWVAIVALMAFAAVITGTSVNLVLPKWYRATAVLRPISTSAIEGRISGLVGGLGGGGLGGLASSLTGSGSDAEEYVAILNGFRFNVALAQRHALTDELLKPGLLGFMRSKPKDRDWAVYRILESRFDSEFSLKTGNLTLTFEAKNRSDAELILGYYVADLLDLLRTRDIRDATSAIDSLEAEAASTPDPILRAQLYELVAKQVERKKTAQVEADFAFRVLDPPAASDRPSRPNVMLDMIIAALLGFFFAMWLVMRYGRPRAGASR